METKELKTEAKLENIRMVVQFVAEELASHGCNKYLSERIELAVEEMLVNVANYAYPEKDGEVTLTLAFPEPETVSIEIKDCGIPYDPLSKEDPNIRLPLRKRGKGGLGIFMAKKIMDEMEYGYENGVNHITMRKRLD